MRTFGLVMVAGGILLIYWVHQSVSGQVPPSTGVPGTPGLKLQPGTAGQ